jgi:Pterin 4 alpha carbinolamine dehydratase
MDAGPEIGPTNPSGRSGGRDHRPFKDLARGDRNITFGFASVKCGRRLTRGASNMIEALASKTCTPCRGGILPLTRERAELFHAQAPDWQLSGEAHRIERSFRFRNFREALTFVREIGELAEAEGHLERAKENRRACEGICGRHVDDAHRRRRAPDRLLTLPAR